MTVTQLGKCTVCYPRHERTLIWNDPDVGMEWPLAGAPLLSTKDGQGRRLRDVEVYLECFSLARKRPS